MILPSVAGVVRGGSGEMCVELEGFEVKWEVK
jgi:hypothetical protein